MAMRFPRRLLLAIAGMAAALLLMALGTVYTLLQPERFSAMLQAQAHGAGLELRLASPASPSLFPRPAIELRGITVTALDGNVPILLAARGSLALPWRALLQRQTVISRLQIEAPRVDLDALQAWLAEQQPHDSHGSPILPRIDAGVSIDRGSIVRGNQVLLDDLSLDAGSLHPDRVFTLDAQALSDGAPWQLRLHLIPGLRAGVLRLDDIGLTLSRQDGSLLKLAGEARWRGAADADAQLAGQIEDDGQPSYALGLTLRPADQNQPLNLHLTLQGPGQHVDLSMPPLALMHWWNQLRDEDNPQLAMPPLDGQIDADQLDMGGVQIKGLKIRAGTAVPAGSTSALAPPSPAGAGTP